MNAWLLTWEGTEGSAVLPDLKIIAILSSRKSSGKVAVLVETLYGRTINSAYDMARFANKGKVRDMQYMHPYSTDSRFFYGSNPCIFARQVVNLTVEKDDVRGTELIRWTEPAIFRNARSGSGIEEAEPARDCEHLRALRPLAPDIDCHWPS